MLHDDLLKRIIWVADIIKLLDIMSRIFDFVNYCMETSILKVAVAINCVGMANKTIGNYDVAIKMCKEAYDIKVQLYGINHSDTGKYIYL